jgi:hypothetical protein
MLYSFISNYPRGENAVARLRMTQDKPALLLCQLFSSFSAIFYSLNGRAQHEVVGFRRALTTKRPFRILFVRLLYEKFGDSHHEHIRSKREKS